MPAPVRITLRWFLDPQGRMIVRSDDLRSLKPRYVRAFYRVSEAVGFRYEGGPPGQRSADPDAPLALIRGLMAEGFEVCGVSQGEIFVYNGLPPGHDT